MKTPVTVLGLGAMGTALAHAFLTARVDIGGGNEFDVGNVSKLAHQFLAPGAWPDRKAATWFMLWDVALAIRSSLSLTL